MFRPHDEGKTVLETTNRNCKWAVGWMLAVLLATSILVGGTDLPTVGPVELPWCSEQPLDWNDFQGEPPIEAALRTELAAIHIALRWHVTSQVEYNRHLDRWEGTVDLSSIEVTNVIDPSRSWVAPGKQSNEVLNHEQRHFDLNEVYRLKLLSALPQSRTVGNSAETVKKELNEAIYSAANKILSKLQEVQEQYDEMTHHGTSPEGQAEWDKKIAFWSINPSQAPQLPA